jgi:hypothetical protein
LGPDRVGIDVCIAFNLHHHSYDRALPDSQFNNLAPASSIRANLVFLFNTAMTFVQNGQYAQATNILRTLQGSIKQTVKDPNQTALNILIGNQIAKLAAM